MGSGTGQATNLDGNTAFRTAAWRAIDATIPTRLGSPSALYTIFTVRQHELWKPGVSAEGAASYEPWATPQEGWFPVRALKARFKP